MKWMKMKLYVDSGEPKEFAIELVKAGFDVKQRMLRWYECQNCGNLNFIDEERCTNCSEEPDVETKKKAERIADIVPENMAFGIEIKKWHNKRHDLTASLIDGRFYDQCEKLGAAFGEDACICVEGTVEDIAYEEPKISNWVRSTPAEAMFAYHVHFHQYTDIDELASFLRFAMNKAGKPPKNRVKRERYKIDKRIRALMNCDNVGYETACVLALMFKSLNGIATAEEDVIRMLYGFGDKTLASLGQFFHGDIKLPKGWEPKKQLVKKI